ncbi:MAG: GNAT family N-acetyltransferase [Phycisphaerales bacterium]|nr:GNAT family N-acetyltransferase [Phycisphaerales bacterium]
MSEAITAFQIRLAIVDDLPAAAALAAELVRMHHRLDPQRFSLLSANIEAGYERFLADRLRDPQAVVLVADATGEIAAYAYGQLEPRDWMRLLDAHGRIHDVIVAGGRRRAGVGEAIVARLVSELRQRGATRFVLETAWRNEAARRFFAKHGFEPTLVEMTLR